MKNEEDERTALVSFDMGGLIARAAAANMSASVTISCFPQDELPPHPNDLEEQRVHEERATVMGMLEPRPLAKFALGQRVGFYVMRQPCPGMMLEPTSLEGTIQSVSHYMDRPPSYYVRPDHPSAEVLGHGADVDKDEGELHALDQAMAEEGPREDVLAPVRRAINGQRITLFAVPDADHLNGYRMQAAVGEDVEAYDGPRLIVGQLTPRFTMP